MCFLIDSEIHKANLPVVEEILYPDLLEKDYLKIDYSWHRERQKERIMGRTVSHASTRSIKIVRSIHNNLLLEDAQP